MAELMSSVDPAMAVVTGTAGGDAAGCLVGFHGQVSIFPLMWGAWISVKNHSYPIISRSREVAVHFLAADQHGLATHFGGLTGDEVDKFAGVPLVADRSTTPLLAEVPRRLVGLRRGVLEGPTDHSCVLIEVTEIELDGRFEPLRLSAVGDIAPGHPA